MPSSIGDDELKLKQRARRRLIGAVALVLVLILFLPMVLDRAPKPASPSIEVHIPRVDTAEPAPSPSVAESPVREPKPAPPEPVVPPEPIAEKQVEPTPEPVAAKPQPAVEKPEAAPTVNIDSETYFVQVGVFSKADNAKSVRTKLIKNKIQRVKQDTLKTTKGTQTRVRIGPFTHRADAEAVLEKVKRSGEKSAVITAHKASR